ncbi:MAG TPA: DUF6084 family protein [Ktedonobacteraceae bacterium]|nr:DUF6084 family protein [Ktedonobacteraceae bacterium]
MPDLSFEVVGAEARAFAAVPTLIFKLRISNADEQEHIHSVILRSQLQIAVNRRRYTPEAQAQLLEVFGEPARWGETLRPLLWTHTNVTVPQFSGSVLVDMPVSCTYDFEVVGTKYFSALGDGEIPLTFLFSGTIFYENEEENLQVAQISWSKEASYRFPVTVWQDMIAHYYPNSTYIRLHKDVFDQLYRYKATHGLPTWENVITHLLQTNDAEVFS